MDLSCGFAAYYQSDLGQVALLLFESLCLQADRVFSLFIR